MNKSWLAWKLRLLFAQAIAWRLLIFFTIFFILLASIFIASRDAVQTAEKQFKQQLFSSAVTCKNPYFVEHEISKNLPEQSRNLRLLSLYKSNCGLLVEWKTNQGYNGNINFAVVFKDEEVKGVIILQQKETPGIGDKITQQKTDWLLQFTNLKLQDFNNHSFDTISGATISSKGIINAVKNSVNWWQQYGVLNKIAQP